MARTPAKKTKTASRKKTATKRTVASKATLPALHNPNRLPTTMVNPGRAHQLLGGMLNKTLYVAISTGYCTIEQLQPYLTEHLEYMVLLEKKGLLFASGPLKGGVVGDGLTIYNTRTMAHARRLADQDPFVRNGLREYEMREWTLMEGAMTLTVNLSDRSVSMPPAEIDPSIT